MLIGAHVSPAGGLPKAIERGTERGCRAIQIFNQSPRMWRPTSYGDDDVAAFREAMGQSEIDAVLIHAVYLLNCASEDEEIREKSLVSLTHSLRTGQRIRQRLIERFRRLRCLLHVAPEPVAEGLDELGQLLQSKIVHQAKV